MAWNRILLGTILVFNVFLIYQLLWSGHGIFAYYELKERYRELEQKAESLNASNMLLSQEIRLLKSDRSYIEQVIRKQMNFVKPNEILYLFPDASSETPPGAGPDEGKD